MKREKILKILEKYHVSYDFAFAIADELQTKEVSDGEIETPKIVCICGSGRFLKEMHEAEERFTLEGKIVLMIGVNTKDVARTKELECYKPMLDELHLRKIDLADEVYIVNVNGYIGESTMKELEYAISKDKTISSMRLI